MEEKKLTIGKSFLFSFILALLGAAFFFIAFHSSDFDLSIRHFTAKTLWLILGITSIAFSVVLSIIFSLILKKKQTVLPSQFSLLSLFFALLSAILLVVSLFFDFSSASTVALTTSSEVNSTYIVVLRVRGIVGALSAVYFLLPLFPALTEKKKGIISYFSFVPILWALLTLLTNYFNCTTAINDPEKTLLLVLSSCFLLGTLSECRYWIPSKNNGLTSFLLMFSSSVGVAISLLFFVSHVAVFFSVTLPFALSFIDASLYLSVSLFFLSRIINVIRLNKKHIEDASVS